MQDDEQFGGGVGGERLAQTAATITKRESTALDDIFTSFDRNLNQLNTLRVQANAIADRFCGPDADARLPEIDKTEAVIQEVKDSGSKLHQLRAGLGHFEEMLESLGRELHRLDQSI